MASSFQMPTKEQAKEWATGAFEVTRANFATLKEAGLFKLDHAITFSKELTLPFEKENFSVPAMQATLLAHTDDRIRGFTIMNALAFIREVIGDLIALLLGRSITLFAFEIVYAFLVAYVLYWLVVHAEGNDYKLVAIGLYVIYTIINTIQAVVTLGLIVPPFFYMCKTVASLCCAYYAFKIEKLTAGATLLKESDGIELGVAE
jgi:hypothetical protein